MLPHPLPWYVAGPLIGLVVPGLLLLGNKPFGISSNFRHLCAVVGGGRAEFFRYDWRRLGGWNLAFLAGIFAGAVLAWQFAPGAAHRDLARDRGRPRRPRAARPERPGAARDLQLAGLWPPVEGFVVMVVGGFLVGFGTAYAGGCTSGHAIAGLADGQAASLLAVCGFFAGGLAGTHVSAPARSSGSRDAPAAVLPARRGVWYRPGRGRGGVVVSRPGDVPLRRVPHVRHHRRGGGDGGAVAGWSSGDLACAADDGTPLGFAPKQLGRGVRYLAGGTMFGLGWALTGACPGPLVALVGAGAPVMVVTIRRARSPAPGPTDVLRPRLPH